MNPATAELFEFVWQRTEETIRELEERGDELRARFAQRSLTMLTDVRMSLDERPSIGELMAHRFLRRLAQDYRDHADFQRNGVSTTGNHRPDWRARGMPHATWEPEGKSGATVCTREPRGLGTARSGQLVS